MNKFIPVILNVIGAIFLVLSIMSLLRFAGNYAANSMYVEAHWSAMGYWSFQFQKFFSNLLLCVQFFAIAKIAELFSKLKAKLPIT